MKTVAEPPPVLGGTAFHVAALNGKSEAVAILLNHGANVNASGWYGMKPLHRAVQARYHTSITALLRHGAVPQALEKWLRTPFMVAAAVAAVNMMNLLLQSEIYKSSTDVHGQTALRLAALQLNLKAHVVLAEAGRNPYQLDCTGCSPV
jgi:ankyrin repeat protein